MHGAPFRGAVRGSESRYDDDAMGVDIATVDELAQQVPLVRVEILTLVRAGDLRAAGFRLEPTGRNPRYFTAVLLDGMQRHGRLGASLRPTGGYANAGVSPSTCIS